MSAKTWNIIGLAGVALMCGGYVAYPFVTLYRLDEAVAHGDAGTLRRLIDWPEVRKGIEADMADNEGELAPFGAGFMRTIAVKEALTPENVMAALRTVDAAKHRAAATWPRGAWVEGARAVVVDLGTVRLRMQLQGTQWRITRAWLPETVLTRAREIARN